MATRTAYVGTQVAGDVLTAANFSKLPGGWIGYVDVTAGQTGITAETDLTNLTLTVTVGSSRRIKITAHVRVTTTTAAGVTTLYVKEGSTRLTSATVGQGETFSDTFTPMVCLTPSAGSHTYKLSLASVGGSVAQTLADADEPASLLVEDIGPAS